MQLSFLLQLYGNLVERHPISSQICTAGVLSTVADIISQRVIERRSASYNVRRTIIMAICGFFYFGPAVTLWYTVLGRRQPGIFISVVLDQFAVSPLLLAGFIVVQTALRGHGVREVRRRFANEYVGIIIVNWLVWVPTQAINFKFIPFEYRMLFSQVVALFWNCYICWKTSGKSSESESSTNTKIS